MYFNQVGLGQADQLLEINRVKFENEDIDYTEYVQKADEAFQDPTGLPGNIEQLQSDRHST